jgi:two-component system, LuxR family, sensor kinase FixL
MASMPIDGQQGQYASTTAAKDMQHRPGVEQSETLQLRSLMQAPALIALLGGPDHVYEFVNERYVQLLGDRDFVGRPVREAVPEAVEQGLVEILDRVYATGEPFIATEMALRFAQGTTGTREEGFYNFVYQPVRDGRGAVTGIMVHAVDVTKEVLARCQLEQLAAERAATLSQMADGVIIVDTSGHITFQNEAARRLLGVDGVSLSLGAWLEKIKLLTPDGAPLPLEETWLARTVQGGVPTLGVERRIRRPDGTEIVMHGSATPVIAENGSRYGSVFTFRDITDRKQLEEELRIRARQQEAVARLGQDALATPDPTALFQQAAMLVRDVLGVDHCQFLEYLPHEDAFLLRAGTGRTGDVMGKLPVGAGTESQAGYTVQAGGAVIVDDLRRETRFTTPEMLREHGVISSVSVVVRGSDQLFGVLEADSSTPRSFTQDDVHFLSAVANVLAAALERHRLDEARFALAAIVESSSDAIISASMDGIITNWDRGAEHLYGYQASEAIGQPVSLIVPPDRADEVSTVLAQMRRGESVEHIETVRRHKDGHPIDISMSVSPIKDASGTITGALSIAHDIGKRKRLERERARHQQELTTRVLQAQEDERKRIARELHDDTAQSLSSLLISLDLLEAHVPEDEPALRVGFDRVRGIAKRALDSVRTLAHGLRPTILDDFGLDAALEWIAVDHTATFGVPVTVAAEEIPAGRLGPEAELALFRIAQEALTNSGRHAGATSLRMTLLPSRRAVKLVVEDDGQGFDADSLTGPSREAGLGLHGIQERVQLLGAGLDVRSAPGQGTRIAVTVPLVSAKARPRRQTAYAETGGT